MKKKGLNRKSRERERGYIHKDEQRRAVSVDCSPTCTTQGQIVCVCVCTYIATCWKSTITWSTSDVYTVSEEGEGGALLSSHLTYDPLRLQLSPTPAAAAASWTVGCVSNPSLFMDGLFFFFFSIMYKTDPRWLFSAVHKQFCLHIIYIYMKLIWWEIKCVAYIGLCFVRRCRAVTKSTRSFAPIQRPGWARRCEKRGPICAPNNQSTVVWRQLLVSYRIIAPFCYQFI